MPVVYTVLDSPHDPSLSMVPALSYVIHSLQYDLVGPGINTRLW